MSDHKEPKQHKELKQEWHNYDKQFTYKLMKKKPVIIKINNIGKTTVYGAKKLTDEVYAEAMNNLMKEMCFQVQGCVFAYYSYTTGEIDLIVTDYHKFKTDAWHGYDVQRMCSITASIAAHIYSKELYKAKEKFYDMYTGEDKEMLYAAYNKSYEELPMFKVRCFNVPEDRAVDMIYYRQRENVRGIYQRFSAVYLGREQTQGLSMLEIKRILKESHNVDIDAVPTMFMIGSCCHKGPNTFTTKRKFDIDYEMPMLDRENKGYLQEIMDTVRHPDERNDWY